MSELTKDSGANHEVGYGRPPKHGQFKKGQSGNPRGRKKGSRSLESALRSVMSQKVTVQTGQGPRKMSKLEATAQLMVNKALSGDASDRRLLVATMRDCGMQLELAETIDAQQADQLMSEDRMILARHLGAGDGIAQVKTDGRTVSDHTSPTNPPNNDGQS